MYRIGVMMALCKGGRVGIYSGKVELLFEEFQMVRPTVISSVPRYSSDLHSNNNPSTTHFLTYYRLYNKIYAEFQDAVALAKVARPDVGVSYSWCRFFSLTLTLSLLYFPTQSQQSWQIELEVLKKFKPLLGGRTQMLITGGAPTGDAVLKFLERFRISQTLIIFLF